MLRNPWLHYLRGKVGDLISELMVLQDTLLVESDSEVVKEVETDF